MREEGFDSSCVLTPFRAMYCDFIVQAIGDYASVAPVGQSKKGRERLGLGLRLVAGALAVVAVACVTLSDGSSEQPVRCQSIQLVLHRFFQHGFWRQGARLCTSILVLAERPQA